MLTIPLLIQSPLAMLGLLTLVIPLGIHLLSKARPRVIVFAHIAFIKVKTSPVLRQLRLTQLVLLGIRMMLLLIMTLILAGWYWQNTHLPLNSHILLTEDWLNYATDIEKKSLIDQVHNADLILLSTKNRSINTTEIAQWSTNIPLSPTLNIWSKVADYTAQLSVDVPISVYTTNRLKQFVGGEISLFQQIKWQVKTIPVQSLTQEYSTNIKVIYDKPSEPLLGYLRAAFEIIKGHNNLNINVDYVLNETNESEVKVESEHSLKYDRVIDLSEQSLAQQQQPVMAQSYTYISQKQLDNIKQADFVLTLTRILYSSQSQKWWLEKTRLSTEQITQSSSSRTDQKALLSNKNSPNPSTQSSLHVWLVLMLVAIFILERWLSEWSHRQLKHKWDQ